MIGDYYNGLQEMWNLKDYDRYDPEMAAILIEASSNWPESKKDWQFPLALEAAERITAAGVKVYWNIWLEKRRLEKEIYYGNVLRSGKNLNLKHDFVIENINQALYFGHSLRKGKNFRIMTPLELSDQERRLELYYGQTTRKGKKLKLRTPLELDDYSFSQNLYYGNITRQSKTRKLLHEFKGSSASNSIYFGHYSRKGKKIILKQEGDL